MEAWCTRQNVLDQVLEDYVLAAEQKNPAIVDRCIQDVTGEVRDAVAVRYRLPFDSVPEVLRWIVSVIAAYRIVGSITSMVTEEGATANEWIPLQRQVDRANKIIDGLAKGERKLPAPAEELNSDREDAAVSVITAPPFFDLTGF